MRSDRGILVVLPSYTNLHYKNALVTVDLPNDLPSHLIMQIVGLLDYIGFLQQSMAIGVDSGRTARARAPNN